MYGSSQILLITAKEFKKQGHHVLVVVSEDGPLVQELQSVGIETRVIRLGILRRKYFTPWGLLNRLRVLSSCFRSMGKLVREQKTDLVYSNTSSVLIGALIARYYHIRHVWHIHETIMRPVFICRLIGWMMRNWTARIIVVSNGVLQHWMPFVKNRDLFTVVYNGIDTAPFEKKTSSVRAEFNIQPGALLIGVVGMIHFIKGHDYFLRIAGRIFKAYPQARFLIVGDAFPGYEYLYADLKKLAREENIYEQVYFTGFRNDIGNILQALDLLVMPSVLPDSFPTVILEGMAAQKPVVATALGGALEMIEHGVTGLLIPVNDPENAMLQMKPLLDDEMLRKKMGVEEKKRLRERFSLEAFHENIINAVS
jgi:glycosyltransferase involved in cell wall biosynthesis